MKYWITKFALTKGIFAVEAKELPKNGMLVALPRMGESYTSYYHGNDWHTTERDALVCAEQMRLARIASLKKSISKMENLSFLEAP